MVKSIKDISPFRPAGSLPFLPGTQWLYCSLIDARFQYMDPLDSASLYKTSVKM